MITSVKKQIGACFKALPRRAWLLLLLPLSFAISALAANNIFVAEQVFARGFYPVVAQIINAVTGLLPFSVLEFGIITLVIILIVILVRFIRKLVKNKDVQLLWRFLLNALCTASVVLFLFTILCGVNYHRRPFSYYSGLEVQPSSVQELYALCADLAGEANALRAQITAEDERGTPRFFDEGYQPVAQDARDAMRKLAQDYDVMSGRYPLPKPVLFSNFMSRTEITGVYSPFTMEANVNIAATEYTIPATMCHELSHLRGFMREDEANFIAYLACRGSGNVELQYSGTMLALVYAGNQLYAASPELYSVLRQSYSSAVMRDFQVDAEYWQQFDNTVISEVSNAVNDTYLKANSQEDGVKSYGRMVDLLLADRSASADNAAKATTQRVEE